MRYHGNQIIFVALSLNHQDEANLTITQEVSENTEEETNSFITHSGWLEYGCGQYLENTEWFLWKNEGNKALHSRDTIMPVFFFKWHNSTALWNRSSHSISTSSLPALTLVLEELRSQKLGQVRISVFAVRAVCYFPGHSVSHRGLITGLNPSPRVTVSQGTSNLV